MLYQLRYASAVLRPLWGRGDAATEPGFRGLLRATTLKRIAQVGSEKWLLGGCWSVSQSNLPAYEPKAAECMSQGLKPMLILYP